MHSAPTIGRDLWWPLWGNQGYQETGFVVEIADGVSRVDKRLCLPCRDPEAALQPRSHKLRGCLLQVCGQPLFISAV